MIITDHSKCGFSTGIDDSLTAGQGKLDVNGFWEFPCQICEDRMNGLLCDPLNHPELRSILLRQQQIERHQPKCPECQTDQVQIMFKAVPARWRCRRCKHLFVSEPADTSKHIHDVRRSDENAASKT